MLSNLEITVHKKNPKAAKLQETEDGSYLPVKKKIIKLFSNWTSCSLLTH